MSKSNSTDASLVTHFVYKIPKKNHDAMLQLCKQSNEIFMQHGVPRYDVFRLNNTDVPMEGFTNIANTVSANQDKEVWVDDLMVKMQKDERMEPLMKQSFDLISSGTSFIMGEFDRLSV